MKRTIAAILILAMILAGCGTKTEQTDGNLPDGAPGALPGVVKAEGRPLGIQYLNVSGPAQ